MSRRSNLSVALIGAALLLAGCGDRASPAPEAAPPRGDPRRVEPGPPPAAPPRTEPPRVTLHVTDMAERLDLT